MTPGDVGRGLAERRVEGELAGLEALGSRSWRKSSAASSQGTSGTCPDRFGDPTSTSLVGRDERWLWPRCKEKEAVGLPKKSSRSEIRSGSGSGP